MSKVSIQSIHREAVPICVVNAMPENFAQASIQGRSVFSSPYQRPLVIERSGDGFQSFLSGVCPPVGRPEVSFWTGGIGEFDYEGKFALAFQRMDRARGRVSVISPPLPSLPAFDLIPTVADYTSGYCSLGEIGMSDLSGGKISRFGSVFYLGTGISQNVRIEPAGGAYRSVTVWLNREGNPGGALYAQLFSVKWILRNSRFGFSHWLPVPDQPLTDGSEFVNCSDISDGDDPAFITFRFKTRLTLGEGWYALVLCATDIGAMDDGNKIYVMGYDFAKGQIARVTGQATPAPSGWDSSDWSSYVTVPWTPPTSFNYKGFASLDDVVGRFITFTPEHFQLPDATHVPMLAGTVVAATASHVTVAPAVYHDQPVAGSEYNFGGFDFEGSSRYGSFADYILAEEPAGYGSRYGFMVMRLNPDTGSGKLGIQAYYDVKRRGWTISKLSRLQGDHATDTYDAIRILMFTPELGEWKELAIVDRPYTPPS